MKKENFPESSEEEQQRLHDKIKRSFGVLKVPVLGGIGAGGAVGGPSVSVAGGALGGIAGGVTGGCTVYISLNARYVTPLRTRFPGGF